ncbi:MAG TPA: pyruvate dehydrogenase (acetyl-transferring) E1 component subunit alpha [Haliscomenobacter sp.]|uniref:pyruvate dehydrogenase (acetyl-transferring) E1 component subunit alpha n=1 Tax=Haliscomenobacter sp. TaxID=2717303 RepID=UPI002C36EBC0|nr:pyruvate dehydrogenase (acetyl-transferring) E1 component subunit alpha [Haliscomenobacter sp.]HOY21367.1 pyruvate dehydrogenase (acetyl-transferring) E1 component subunit alpha [Haliscomenobacter sp.]HPH18780.1 pyruvate dehydrogenase (acetyl-transferring) E1 component subunit alpha [Haliscomenobacter sp.]
MDSVVEKKASAKKRSNQVTYSKEQYLFWYELMLRIRRFEERALMMYGQQKIRGFCHVYIGQEAIAAGIESAITKQDGIVTAYRQHGIALGRGVTSREAMAELYGKATGIVKGKGGSMHFFDARNKYFGGNGIVGAQIPIGTGIGFAEKYKGTQNFCVTMFGDGASRQGALYESFNMAMTWKLPVLYIVENNGYAMGTSVERTSNVEELWKIGLSFEMPSESVDGMSPESVHEAISRAAEHIRAGKGPYFLEIRTYRYKGHSVSDPAKYRTKEEVQAYQDRDPIKVTEDKIISGKIATVEEIQAIKDKIKAEIEDAVQFAEDSPYPDASELFTDNYTDTDYPYIKY